MAKISKICAFSILVSLVIVGLPGFALAQTAPGLTVPYILEVPAGTSGGYWKNACEEASFAMLEKYYTGKKKMNVAEGKAFMTMLFNKQNVLYDSNKNSDMAQSQYLINTFSSYGAKIIDNPTIVQIKSELRAGHPIITPHYGFDLHNPNIPFLRTGTSYHMMVVTGYDDSAKQFIVNDPGDTVDGEGYRYDYDLFMSTLHDYDYETRKANGPARAIFTFPKLISPTGSSKIFYVHDNIRQYVTNPTAFRNHGWKWEAVNNVSVAWFNTFMEGEAINK